MTKRQTIQIEAVANGYIVTPAHDASHAPYPTNVNDIHVFQELEGRHGLQEWLAGHFGDDYPRPADPAPIDPFDQ